MQIPFADALLSRLGRREAGLELIEEIEDEAVESVDADDLPSAEPALLLQRMENRLIRHHLAGPEVLSAEELRKLRYILNFARLADFEPGAAGPGGSRGRGDVSVGAEIAPWRSRVADALYGPLREEPDPITALKTARDALAGLAADQDDQRQVLIERHGNDFSAAELDAEVGYKKLVTVLGGGGGAGFVYIGGMQRLLEAGQVPDYMIGASFGSIMGSLVSRALPVPIEEYVAWAKTVSYRAILGPERLRRRHGLAGMFALRFDQFAHAMLSREDGRRMRMSDLAIPFDIVVAGVRRQPYTALPSRFRRPALAALQMRSVPFRPIGIGPVVGPDVASGRVHRLAGRQADHHRRRRPGPRLRRRRRGVVLVGHSRCAAPRNERPADDPDPRRPVSKRRTSRRSSTAARRATSRSNWRGSGSATAGSAPATRAIWRSIAFTRNGIRGTCGWCRSPRRSSCRWCATCLTPTTSSGSSRRCRRRTWRRPPRPSTVRADGGATASIRRSR